MQTTRYPIVRGWLIAWITIFILIVISSIFAPNSQVSTILKLGGIVLCLFYAARTFPHDYLLLLAMLGTCIADIILAGNNISPIGIIVFLITQLIHLYRLNGKRLKILSLIYAGVAAICLTLNIILKIFPLLFVAVTFYAITLITNLIVSAFWQRQQPNSPAANFALCGFSLFACCDFCTGISYLSLVGVFPAFFYAPANFFVWLFYYPSQILIANTGKCDIMKRKKVKN